MHPHALTRTQSSNVKCIARESKSNQLFEPLVSLKTNLFFVGLVVYANGYDLTTDFYSEEKYQNVQRDPYLKLKRDGKTAIITMGTGMCIYFVYSFIVNSITHFVHQSNKIYPVLKLEVCYTSLDVESATSQDLQSIYSRKL